MKTSIPKRDAFIAAFRATASITAAAKAAKCERGLHYRWLEDPAYCGLFEDAKDEAAQSLEDEAVRRAHEGVLEPVVYKGAFSYERDSKGRRKLKKPLAIRKYSDAVLIFLLKGFRPEKYRDRGSVELTGKDGGPIEIVERLNAARKRRDASGD